MKKIFIFLSLVMLFSISVFAQRGGDWRTGKWRRDFPENLLNISASSNLIASHQSVTNPWGFGVNVGYQNRVRPYSKTRTSTWGWGFHTGIHVYPGLNIRHSATGASEEVKFGKYKTYTYVPLMGSIVGYLITRPTASLFMEISAGGNIMLGQKDFSTGGRIYVQEDPANSIKVTHFIPTVKCLVGFKTEISTNIRFRGVVGYQGELFGYTDTYSGYYVNGAYKERETVFSNDPTHGIVFELGLAFSL
jgi:hypothetical protein